MIEHPFYPLPDVSPYNMVGFNLEDISLQNSTIKLTVNMPIVTSAQLPHNTDNFPVNNELRVDMADAKIENKSLWLVTNVGSCIALCMYDKFNRCGGMAHIMLPKSNGNGARVLPYKYADTAVPALANAIRKMGNGKSFLIAKIAGGASMFSDIKCHLIKIGQKNIETVKEALSANNIPLVAEDVGGNHGRKIAFNVTTGTVIVRSLNGVEKKL